MTRLKYSLLAPFQRDGRFYPWFYAGVLVTLLYLYMLMMEHLGGFAAPRPSSQYLEVALILYIYGLCFNFLQPGRWRGLVAMIPLLMLYLVHDLFYIALGKVFRLINLGELPELLQILPWQYSAIVLASLVGPLILFAYHVDYRQPRRLLLWSMPLLMLSASIEGAPDLYTQTFERAAPGIVIYSDGKSVEENGRLAMLTYREAKRSSALAHLAPYRNRTAYDQQANTLAAELISTGAKRPRNVHLIVLESFVDPRLFHSLRFSSPPAHPDFVKLFADRLGLSKGPVFGGATAQAEFEVLCGVPAFEQLSSIEFNIFTGSPAHCLPGTLADIGYRTVASNTYKPNFFNALPAYKGTGFAESYFPSEFSGSNESYLKLGDTGVEEYLFDAKLFEQNLRFVRDHLEKRRDKPLFNYLLTIYGHTPHLLDPQRRPSIIELHSEFKDEHLTRVVNQFYYRTEAIASYVQQLLEIDHDSLIILVADHVPPLQFGPNTYNALGYLNNRQESYYYNRIAIVENGSVTLYPEIHHYDVPQIVLDYASDGAWCRNHACSYMTGAAPTTRESYRERYLTLMAHAAE